MTPDLFPTFQMPTIDLTDTTTDPQYGGSFLFDFDAGDFVLDGAGRVVKCDGYQAWAQWCVKAVITERFAYLVYSSDYATELEAIRQLPRDMFETEFERAVTEALTVDPRTESVTDFTFDWSGDGVQCAFTITPVIGTPQRVEVKISGG